MDDKLKQIQKLLDAAEGNLHSARNLMREVVGNPNAPVINPEEKAKNLNVIEEGKIIEGVYDGENMIGPDGKDYPVPANYASKSKLVEGDVLKLTIADDGSFIYKQIKPIDRRKTVGTLTYTNGNYAVNADGKTYKVLQASVTYYKGEPGDQVSLILPKDHESTWGAIENIIKKVDENGMPIASDQPPAEDLAATEEAGTSEVQAEAETQEEETEVEKDEDNGPEIVFPANGQSSKASEDSTVPKEPEVPKVEPDTSTDATPDQSSSTKSDKNNGGQGIKELEI
jgi:hypothetical protein